MAAPVAPLLDTVVDSALVEGRLLDAAVERAVDGLRRVLVAAARSGRTVTAGEASAAAYGAWVPAGLSRALAELSLRCASAQEPDLTALVEHRRPPGARPAGPVVDLTGHADHAVLSQHTDLERHRCWRAWGGEPAVGAAPSTSAGAAPRRSTGQHPAAGAFAEPGVVCGGCLTVVRGSGACRCG